MPCTSIFSTTAAYWKTVLGDESILLNPDGQKLMSGDIFIVESLYKVRRKHYLRTEFQHLSTRDDRGSMAMALAEYSIAPHWFFSVQDIYNYGNPDEAQRLHYPLASVVYTSGTSSLSALLRASTARYFLCRWRLSCCSSFKRCELLPNFKLLVMRKLFAFSTPTLSAIPHAAM